MGSGASALLLEDFTADRLSEICGKRFEDRLFNELQEEGKTNAAGALLSLAVNSDNKK